jgi:hypothetical protein
MLCNCINSWLFFPIVDNTAPIIVLNLILLWVYYINISINIYLSLQGNSTKIQKDKATREQQPLHILKISMYSWLNTKTSKISMHSWLNTKIIKISMYSWLNTKTSKISMYSWLNTKTSKISMYSWLNTKTSKISMHSW